MKELDTDILVVGGGAAGLSAAISARRLGAEVTLACRSTAGKSGNTLVANGGLALYDPAGSRQDTPERYASDIDAAGGGIGDPAFIRRFVRESQSVPAWLEACGVAFLRIDGQRHVGHSPGHSTARNYTVQLDGASGGRGLLLPLLAAAVELGVRILDHNAVVRLETDGQGVCGALCLDSRTAEPLWIRAGAVVLASGGGASLFWAHNNTTDVCCDSCRLAYEAGAWLRDMEMVQFFPTMMFSPVKTAVNNPLFGAGAVLRNARGEAFMKRYDPKGDLATRDVMARAVKSEIDAGRGNPDFVFVDCSGVDSDVLRREFGGLSHKLAQAGLDLQTDLIPVAPAAHFFMGGVGVDSDCRSSVEGLYACGEAAGGLHGANRLAGAALAEAVVTGRLAGQAAVSAKKRPHSMAAAPSIVLESHGAGEASAEELAARLRRAMWKDASLVRSAESLAAARIEVESIAARTKDLRLSSASDLIGEYRLLSLVTAARLLIQSAGLRRESRGAHYRSDFPEADDSFKGSFFCRRQPDGRSETVFLPAGQHPAT